MSRKTGDTNAARALQRGSTQFDRLAYPAPYLIHPGTIITLVCLQNENEFIAAHATGKFTLVEQKQNPAGDLLQKPVSSSMAQRIVDRLELIEVEKADSHLP